MSENKYLMENNSGFRGFINKIRNWFKSKFGKNDVKETINNSNLENISEQIAEDTTLSETSIKPEGLDYLRVELDNVKPAESEQPYVKEETEEEKLDKLLEQLRNKKDRLIQIVQGNESSETVDFQELDKEDFFLLYNAYKAGKVDLSNIPFHEELRINRMLGEEIQIKTQVYENSYLDLSQEELDRHSSYKDGYSK